MTHIIGGLIDKNWSKIAKIHGEVYEKKWPHGQKIWPEMIKWAEKGLLR